MKMLLRLDNIRQDEVGWIATFYGKPDIHGNSITVPIAPEDVAQLEIGSQYTFELVEENLRVVR